MGVRDPEGTDFPRPYLAREHGRLVARELMQHRESATRSGRLNVYDREGTLCFDVLFVTADESIFCLPRACQVSLANRGDARDQIDDGSVPGNNRASRMPPWCHEGGPLAGASI